MEKILRVVLRGVLQNIPLEDIESELKERDFVTTGINRLSKKTENGKVDIPLILVDLVKNAQNKEIYNISDILLIRVRVKSQSEILKTIYRLSGIFSTLA